MLNSAEHEIYPAQNIKMQTIQDISTFMGRKNRHSRLMSGNFVQLNGIMGQTSVI